MAILISNKIDFKTKNITRVKESFYNDKGVNLSGRCNNYNQHGSKIHETKTKINKCRNRQVYKNIWNVRHYISNNKKWTDDK